MTARTFGVSLIIVVLLTTVTWLFSGPSKTQVSLQKAADDRLAAVLENFTKVDAIEFFEKGGRYMDFPGDPPFDRPHVLPLVKTLGEEFGFEWFVLIRPDQPLVTDELVAEIPPGVTRRQVHARLVELQQDFPGEILQEWGSDWFSLDFLDEEEAAFYREESSD